MSTLGGDTADFGYGASMAARFSFLHAVVVDLEGSVYVADRESRRTRKLEYKALGTWIR